PAQGAEVVLQLLLVARADQHACDGGALQQPIERDLRQRLAGFLGDLVHRIDHAVEPLLIDRWREAGRVVQPTAGRQWLAAPDLAGQAAPAERTPDNGPHALVEP